MPNSIITLFATPEALLDATDIEIERALLRVYQECTDDQMRRMTTAQVVSHELFAMGGYAYDAKKRKRIDKLIGRLSKKLEDAGLIEAPEPDNDKG